MNSKLITSSPANFLKLDESTTSSEDKVLDAMFEQIFDTFFPGKANPFNPKKPKKSTK